MTLCQSGSDLGVREAKEKKTLKIGVVHAAILKILSIISFFCKVHWVYVLMFKFVRFICS